MNETYDSEIKIPIHFDASHFFLKHHKVNGLPILPGVAHLQIARNFAKYIYPFENFNCIEEVSWVSPIICSQNSIDIILQITKMLEKVKFCFKSYDEEIFSSGYIYNKKYIQSKFKPTYERFSFENIVNKDFIYEEFIRLGITYGAFFKCLNNVKRKDNTGIAKIYSELHQLNFVNLLDCSFQSGMAISLSNNFLNLMPVSLGILEMEDNFRISNGANYFVLTKKINQFRTDITIADDQNNVVIKIKDLGVKPGKF